MVRINSPLFFRERGQLWGMARTPVTDKWPDIRLAAEQGVPIKVLSTEYDIDEGTIRQRSKRENWLTPVRMQNKLATLSRKVPGTSSEPPDSEKKDGDNTKVVELIAQTWAEKGEQVRQLAWHIGQSSLRGLDKTGIPVKDAGDAAKLIKMMREATGQFQDQPLVQMAVFNGANSGFDAETVQKDSVIMEDGAEYETEM